MLPFRTVSWSIRERKTASSFFRWTKRELNQLIDLSTCGLHTPHNIFKHGEKAPDWQVKN